MWQALFSVTNLVAVAAWAVLLFAPARARTGEGVLYLGVGLLCLAYAAMAIALLGGLADPARVPGAATMDLSDYSIAGLRALFLSDGGLVLGWTHYLALDLFTGLWIARDAEARRFSRLTRAPVLMLTFLAGPLGLLLWLAVRRLRTPRG